MIPLQGEKEVELPVLWSNRRQFPTGVFPDSASPIWTFQWKSGAHAWQVNTLRWSPSSDTHLQLHFPQHDGRETVSSCFNLTLNLFCCYCTNKQTNILISTEVKVCVCVSVCLYVLTSRCELLTDRTEAPNHCWLLKDWKNRPELL